MKAPQRVYVQGGSRGLGLAVAERFARGGAAVAVGARHIPAELERRLRSLGASEVVVAELDASVPSAVTAVFELLERDWPHLDALVNVVGPPVRREPWEHIDAVDWSVAFELGVMSAVWTTRAALPLLRSAALGRVVNVSALSATVQAAGLAPYSAAKAALNSVTKTMAIELAPGVLVNAVAPGAVMSEKLEASLGEAGMDSADVVAAFDLIKQRHDVRSDLGKVATADEVAAVIGFLCSADNGHVTGANIHVDGGSAVSM